MLKGWNRRMFCRKCGAKIEENQKFCTACGIQIENREQRKYDTETEIIERPETESSKEDTEYAFLTDCGSRDKVMRIIKWSEKITEVIAAILTVLFIVEKMELAEGYRFSVYLLGYFTVIAPLFLIYAIENTAERLMEYQVSQLKPTCSRNVLFGAVILELILTFVAVFPFLFANDMEKAGWAMLIGFGGVMNLIMHFKMSILCIILTVAIDLYIAHTMIRREDGEKSETGALEEEK